MSDANAVARDQLRAFIERIERLEEEKKSISDDIKDVYGEAKGTGFDTKVLRKLISIRKQDREERMEQEAILDMYMIALGMVDEPAGYDEPRQSEPVERQPAVALRSDAGLNILTKHEDIRTAPVTAEESLANGPCEAVSERTAFQVDADASAEAGVSGQPEMIPATSAESAGEVAGSASDLPTYSELLGGFPVAAAEVNAEETGVLASTRQGMSVERGMDQCVTGGESAATSSDHSSEGGADEVDGSAPCAGIVPTSNTGEGAANTALPAKPKVSFRPNCQHPENCASGTRDHCWSCRRAMQKSEEMA